MSVVGRASLFGRLMDREDGGLASAGRLALWAALGFASANAALFGQQAPFGAACCAAAGRKNILAAGAGAVLGYVFAKNSEGNLRYIAAVLLVAMVQLVFERVKDRALLSSAVAAAAVAAVGIAFSAIGGGESYGAALAVSESVLAGGGAYFFYRTRAVFAARRPIGAIPATDRACVIVTAAIAAAALTGITFGRVSLGRVAACFVVLVSARFGKESAGAVAGVSTGAAVGAAATGAGWLIGSYGFGGLMAGVFSVFGRVGTAAAFLLVQLLGVFLTGEAYLDFTPVYEAAAACVLLLFTPSRLPGVASLFAAREELPADSATVKALLLDRLGEAAASLDGIADATKTVSKALSRSGERDMSTVLTAAAEQVCRTCSKSAVCWGKYYSDTNGAFTRLLPVLKNGGEAEELLWPDSFKERCPRTEELSDALNREWSSAVASRTVSHKVARVREVVADQFDGMAELLSDMREELSGVRQVERKLTASVKGWFESAALSPNSVTCWSDQSGRLTIEAELPLYKLERVDAPAMAEELSELCKCELGEPVVRRSESAARLIISDKPTFMAEFGAARRAAGAEKHCGDSAESFTDERGAAHLLLSDGMGSGNAAALDSAMTVGLLARMLRAGFRFGAALRLVNSALLVKSGEESIATADAVTIDLFSGRAEFYKAGAAPSFVLKGDHVTKVEAMSLPAGILGGVSFEKSELCLGAGDIVLLVSDGVTASGEDWVASELRAVAGSPAKAIAERIAATAADRRTDGHEDDITVLAVRISDGV